MFHGCDESMAVYRCPNKRVDAQAVYTNNVPVRRVPRLRPRPGDLRGRVGDGRARPRARHRPVRAARSATSCVPGDPLVATHGDDESDLALGSYGLDQCLDAVRGGAAARRRRAAPAPAGWLVGEGMAVGDDRDHPAARALRRRRGRRCCAGRHVRARGRHRRVRQRHHHRARADRRRPRSATDAGPDRAAGSPTPTSSATTPARSARPASWSPARALHAARSRCATCCSRARACCVAAATASSTPTASARPARAFARRVHADAPGRPAARCAPRPLRRHAALGGVQRARLPGRGRPRHRRDRGSCSRCTPPTPARVMNPEQCRGQVEGGVGAGARRGAVRGGAASTTAGAVTTRCFRHYHVPQFADVPRTEVLLRRHRRRPRPARREVDERERRTTRSRRRSPTRSRDATGIRLVRAADVRDRVWRLHVSSRTGSTEHGLQDSPASRAGPASSRV